MKRRELEKMVETETRKRNASYWKIWARSHAYLLLSLFESKFAITTTGLSKSDINSQLFLLTSLILIYFWIKMVQATMSVSMDATAAQSSEEKTN